MRGGVLPPALLCAALGLALAFAPRRAWLPGLMMLVATAACLAFTPIPGRWEEGVFLGCWVSVAACAAAVHLPRGLNTRAALALAFNAGCWSGAVIAVAGSPIDLPKALPCVLTLLPAAWAVRWPAPIVVKVVASWMVAVAALAATLQFLPVTPGYMPDHLD